MCGLNYTPHGNYSEERCLSTNVAWIKLNETAVPITNNITPICIQKEPCTITDSDGDTTTKAFMSTVTEPSVGEIKIPPSVTFSSIPILVIAVIILGLTVVILY